MPNYKLDLAFFHELGHFVAAELNAKHFAGPTALAFELFPDATVGRNGQVTTDISNYYDPDQPNFLDCLPMHLASLIYGCFFQSYSLGWQSLPEGAEGIHRQFERCCDNTGEGKEDMESRHKILVRAGQNGNQHAFTEIENNYFQRLVKERQLDPFMKLNREAYFPDRPPVRANLKALKQDCAPHIDKHSALYLAFVADLRACLDKNHP